MRGHPPATEGRAELSCFLPGNEGDGRGGQPRPSGRDGGGVGARTTGQPGQLGKSLACRTLVPHSLSRAEDNSFVEDDCGAERRRMQAAREGPQHSQRGVHLHTKPLCLIPPSSLASPSTESRASHPITHRQTHKQAAPAVQGLPPEPPNPRPALVLRHLYGFRERRPCRLVGAASLQRARCVQWDWPNSTAPLCVVPSLPSCPPWPCAHVSTSQLPTPPTQPDPRSGSGHFTW